MNVTWVHFPLHPETLDEGVSLEELFAGRDIDIEKMYARMKALMDEEGLQYGKRTHTYNSRLAQELGKWADTQPGGAALHDAMFAAYFVDAKNISDTQTLISIADSVGLSTTEAESVLHVETQFQRAYEADQRNRDRSYENWRNYFAVCSSFLGQVISLARISAISAIYS